MAFGDWDLFGQVARRRPGPGWQEMMAHREHQWCPPVDVFERDDALVLMVDLPGVLKEDIELRMEANVLTLAGQRRRLEDRQGVRLERPMGRFQRSFRIGLPVTTEGAKATFREGVLEIVLHKAARGGAACVQVVVE
jgi:HSP20 family protein